MDSANKMLQLAVSAPEGAKRREAFLELLSGDDWAQALLEETIGRQGYLIREDFFPDLIAARKAAPVIAADEDKVHRLLQLVGSRGTPELLHALARHMGSELVDHALAHLRTAQGDRADLLLQHLQIADPGWVRQRAARKVIRRGLRENGPGRFLVLEFLAEAGNMEPFLDEIRATPPQFLEEWSALGRAGVKDAQLQRRGLASFRSSPDALALLLRMDPLPEVVAPRMMAAATPEWLLEALEVAIVEKLNHPALLPLAELGIRQGGRQLAAASAWLGTTRTSHTLLVHLTRQLKGEDGHDRIDNMFWVQRRPSSADRALDQGRRGGDPDLMDAAALVRQCRGNEPEELVREILGRPLPNMFESVLHPLCAVHPQAALEVQQLARGEEPEPARRAQEALQWDDVLWQE